MKFGLEQKTIDKITAVFAAHARVKKVVLYGSRAMGTYKNGSDIDLTLFGEAIDGRLANRIALELDDLMLPYGMDLSVFDKIENPDLRAHINRRGRVFYEKKASA